MKRDPALLIAVALGALALPLPLGAASWTAAPLSLALWLAMAAAAIFQMLRPLPTARAFGLLGIATLAGGVSLLKLVEAGASGGDALALWTGLASLFFLVWRLLERAAMLGIEHPGIATLIAAPLIFGFWLLYVWQMLVTGFEVPGVLLPAPSVIWSSIMGARDTLAADFMQTFIKAVIPGFLIGCSAGFVTGLLVDRVPFLQRGLLPLGNLVSALPIVAVAPIMVMWFGFDWQSKAAVVVIMTFFPMLVNTIAGLDALGRMERDLMATYAASYGQTLSTARIPAALPFVFNALKINSTLALIGAIVAEFFGTPIVGMGFRISTEVGRMNISMVWATIAVAAAAGSASYGLIVLAERRFTFWHASFRKP